MLRAPSSMQRWTSLVVGLLAGVALVAAVYRAGHHPGAGPAPSASLSAEPSSPAAAPSSSAGSADPATPEVEPPSEWATDGGIQPLPANAPTSVSFGVLLFTYKGVQFAPKDARAKDEALALAKASVESAQKDFAEAVKKGDRGSTADAGKIPRGVLEPEIEQVLFTLPKATVHPEPLDTPRGYWVLRRNE